MTTQKRGEKKDADLSFSMTRGSTTFSGGLLQPSLVKLQKGRAQWQVVREVWCGEEGQFPTGGPEVDATGRDPHHLQVHHHGNIQPARGGKGLVPVQSEGELQFLGGGVALDHATLHSLAHREHGLWVAHQLGGAELQLVYPPDHVSKESHHTPNVAHRGNHPKINLPWLGPGIVTEMFLGGLDQAPLACKQQSSLLGFQRQHATLHHPAFLEPGLGILKVHVCQMQSGDHTPYRVSEADGHTVVSVPFHLPLHHLPHLQVSKLHVWSLQYRGLEAHDAKPIQPVELD